MKNSFHSFRERWKTTSGKIVLGQRSQPSKTDATSERSTFQFSRVALRVLPTCPLVSGEVLISPEGEKFLAADNGRSALFNSFKLLKITNTLAWTRRVNSIDTVSGIEKQASVTSLGNIDVVMEPTTDQSGSMNIDRRMFRMITGASLQDEDRIGVYVVKKVDYLLGVYIAEVH